MLNKDHTELHSSIIFNEIKKSIEALDENKKKRLLEGVKGVFQFHIKNDANEVQVYTVDLKHDGSVTCGSTIHKADTIIYMSDNDFVSVAIGRITSQKAYNLGKLKIKGQMRLATKLDLILKQLKGKSKL